jgi:NADPH2:quinone reductase
MRALIPDGNASVRMAQIREPHAKGNEVVIAVAAFSINRGETFLLDAPRPGWRPGKDVAGTVVEAAQDGSGPPVGARVVGYAAAGGWAERATVATASVAVLPDNVSTDVAAALPLAGLTAVRLIRSVRPLLGRRLLITGASGGVGHYVTELAIASGAEVVAVTATAERGARLRELGAHTVTDVEDAPGWYDVAMESVGGSSFSSARSRVRPEGELLWFGQAGKEPIKVDFFEWIQGTVGAAITPFDHARSDRGDAADLAMLVRLVAEGRLHPEIGTIGSWEETAARLDDLRRRQLVGNAVLRVTLEAPEVDHLHSCALVSEN